MAKSNSPSTAASASTPFPASPVPGCPPAPSSYTALDKGTTTKLKHLSAAQFMELAGAARELAASTTYAADFGSTAPAQKRLVQWLQVIAGWHDEAERAEQWATYANDQKQLAADAFLEGDYAAFEDAFDFAVRHDDALAKTYQASANLLGARSQSASRAAATRKQKKKAQKPADKKS